MKNLPKLSFISKLPEMMLSSGICLFVGLLIYWLRGVHNAPYVCAIIGFIFPLLRFGISRNRVKNNFNIYVIKKYN